MRAATILSSGASLVPYQIPYLLTGGVTQLRPESEYAKHVRLCDDAIILSGAAKFYFP